MKLDHFCACPYVPIFIKRRLIELRDSNTRSNTSTMKYFRESAQRLNLVDGDRGIFFSDSKNILTPKSKGKDDLVQPTSESASCRVRNSLKRTRNMQDENFRRPLEHDQNMCTDNQECSGSAYEHIDVKRKRITPPSNTDDILLSMHGSNRTKCMNQHKRDNNDKAIKDRKKVDDEELLKSALFLTKVENCQDNLEVKMNDMDKGYFAV